MSPLDWDEQVELQFYVATRHSRLAIAACSGKVELQARGEGGHRSAEVCGENKRTGKGGEEQGLLVLEINCQFSVLEGG